MTLIDNINRTDLTNRPVVASTLRPALLLSSQGFPSGRFRVYIIQCGVENFVSGLGFSSALWPPPLDDALFVLSMCSGLMVA